MKLKYLPTTEPGLKRMRKYYNQHPQLNSAAASAALKQTERTLVEYPFSGEKYEAFDDVREYRISGTAFSVLYAVSKELIWIIDVRDSRGNRSAEPLREFDKHVRKKFHLL